ncbi:hypothetical protein HMPREF1981_00831 [Bacteroides pyogenes F0041]|uniref:Uncharacterized protein n=1 Tax=Bacteroides pyogenes F0041 TaxID=1321819 RepID=U2CPY4_9BACE|nr:hypothetical protein HMPREF1981_00831 [Bacteroides pyogenes F0041]MBB3894171.1 hypothetical protein [Bacteroides pyogenes]SUV31969.1 Uncharacterised protein [Bacteroides pyogenes]
MANVDASSVKSKISLAFLREMLFGVFFKLPDGIGAGNYIKKHSRPRRKHYSAIHAQEPETI